MPSRRQKLEGLFCPECGGPVVNNGSQKAQSGKIRYRCQDCQHRTTEPLKAKPKPKTKIAKFLPGAKGYVVTCAQNATPVNKPFFENLLAYCKFRNYALVVVPLRYRNPTSKWSENQEHDEWWAPELSPYLFDGRASLNAGIMILGDIKTQVTASSPLDGNEALSGARSAILGHPKLALKTVATPQNRLPKILTTTGAVTNKNYTDTRAGKHGDFHHTFGAAVVEIDGEDFYLRQINACRDGSFIDLEDEFSDGKRSKAPQAEALVMGDVHAMFSDPVKMEATFGKGGVFECLKPKRLLWHDVFDNYVRNHHHDNNPFMGIAKVEAGTDSVFDEVKLTVDMIRKYTYPGVKSIIVASNHNDGLARWVRENDWRDDPPNAKFYLRTALAMAEGTVTKSYGGSVPDPFHYWVEKLWTGGDKPILLGRDESYMIKGIENGFHGDKGANGSKATIKSFRRIGVKTVVGHSHSPGINEGCTQVGTSGFLRMEYNAGLSSWMQTDCAIYANGKRTLLFYFNGLWRRRK